MKTQIFTLKRLHLDQAWGRRGRRAGGANNMSHAHGATRLRRRRLLSYQKSRRRDGYTPAMFVCSSLFYYLHLLEVDLYPAARSSSCCFCSWYSSHCYSRSPLPRRGLVQLCSRSWPCGCCADSPQDMGRRSARRCTCHFHSFVLLTRLYAHIDEPTTMPSSHRTRSGQSTLRTPRSPRRRRRSWARTFCSLSSTSRVSFPFFNSYHIPKT
jgi:hypothetical protein